MPFLTSLTYPTNPTHLLTFKLPPAFNGVSKAMACIRNEHAALATQVRTENMPLVFIPFSKWIQSNVVAEHREHNHFLGVICVAHGHRYVTTTTWIVFLASRHPVRRKRVSPSSISTLSIPQGQICATHHFR